MTTKIEVQLLGVFSAKYNTKPLRFRTDKIKALLVYLLLHEGVSVRREQLATLLWPENPDNVARKNLRDALYHLRKTIGQCKPSFSQHGLSTTRKTVTVSANCFEVDVHALSVADPVPDLASLMGGELLAGFHLQDAEPFMDWLLVERSHWHHLSLKLLSQWAEVHLQQKQHHLAQQLAQKQLGIEAWHEAAHRQAMLAYALAQDWAGVARQYLLCQETLQDELGIEPSSATQTLYQSLLEQQRRLTAPRHNLPTTLSPFFGRKKEIAHINAALKQQDYRLFTLAGIGGSGKTRLAIEIARQQVDAFPDGVWFVPLASANDAEEVLPAIADAFDFQLAPDTAVSQQIYTLLANKEALLVLDNLEHLPPGDLADTILALLQETKHLLILTTSRSQLNLRVERIFLIDGLLFPEEDEPVDADSFDAVTLFLEQATRVRGSPLPPNNYPTISQICRLLAGSPLAIELAASLTEMFLVDDIAEKLRDSLATLTTSMEDIPERQHSIRAVFNYSWRLLTDRQQQGLAQLSLFRQPFSWEAAQAVATISRADLLALIKSSWLRLEDDGRYRFHELLREFGQEKLAQHVDWHEQTNGRYINYHLNLLGEHAITFERDLSGQAFSTLRQIRADIANAWRMGLAKKEFNALIHSATPLRELHFHSGLLEQGKRLFDTTIAKLRQVSETAVLPTNAQKLLAIALLHQVSFLEDTTVDTAILHTIEEALALAERVEEVELIINVQIAQARVMWRLGQLDAAFTLSEQLAPFAKNQGTPLQYAHVRLRMATISHVRNHFALGEQIYREILDSIDSRRYPVFVARVSHNLAVLLENIGRYTEARQISEDVLQIWEQIDHKHYKAITLEGLGRVLLLQGQYDLAHSHLQSCLQHYEAVNDLDGIANTHYDLGTIALALEDLDSAEENFQILLETRQKMQQDYVFPLGWVGLSLVALGRGRVDEAVQLVHRCLPFILEEDINVKLSFETYANCYRVLAQADDPAAEKVLK